MTRKKASADPRARRAERQSCSKAPPISHATGGYNRNRRNGINNGRYEWHRRHRSPDNDPYRVGALHKNDRDQHKWCTCSQSGDPDEVIE